MNGVREQVITDIEKLWGYVCAFRTKSMKKFPLEYIYYSHIFYEGLYDAVNEYEDKGVKPNKIILRVFKENVENFIKTQLPMLKENMDRNNKCDLFFRDYNKNKELSLTLKKVIEKNHKLYSYNIHNKVYVMYQFLHEEADDMIAIADTQNKLYDKLIELIPRCKKLLDLDI